jgi:hypothetical protein
MPYLISEPTQTDRNPMPPIDLHTLPMSQSTLELLQRRIVGPEEERPSALDVVDALRKCGGAECKAARISTLRLACEVLADPRMVQMMLLREIYTESSVGEIGQLALALAEVVPALEEDCALIQQCLMHAGLVAEAVTLAQGAIVRHPDSHHLQQWQMNFD